MLRKIYNERLWKIEEKTASHHYHAAKERCRKETIRIWRWTAERKTSRLILERHCLRKARHAVSDSSNAESGIAGIEINILYTDAWASNAYTRQTRGQYFVELLKYRRYYGKAKHPAWGTGIDFEPYREIIVRKMVDNTTQANWKLQFGLLNKLVLLSD